MVSIVFESHSTTFDNEAHLSSGWNDIALSPLGERQSIALRDRYADEPFDAIFCSDLQRSHLSGDVAFAHRGIPVLRDPRLRECDYGDLTQKESSLVTAEKPNRIDTPFPNGESYRESMTRMRSFLEDLLRDHDGQRVMIIGHRATQYGLEHWIKGVDLKEAVIAPWKWQPGWTYTLTSLPSPLRSS